MVLVGRMLDAYVGYWIVIFWPSVWMMVGPKKFNGIDIGCMTKTVEIGMAVDTICGVILYCDIILQHY